LADVLAPVLRHCVCERGRERESEREGRIERERKRASERESERARERQREREGGRESEKERETLTWVAFSLPSSETVFWICSTLYGYTYFRVEG